MLGLIKKGDSVIVSRATNIGGWSFSSGQAIVRGSYIGKMRGCYMVRTGRGKSISALTLRRRIDPQS